MTTSEKKLKAVQRTYLAFTRAAEALLLSVHDHVPAAAADQIELPNVAVIQNLACAYFRISPAVLLSFARVQSYVTARHAAMWLCRQATQHSLAEIGRAFGGRDHGTVIWACNSVANRMDVDPEFRKEMERLHAEALTVLQRTSSYVFNRVFQGTGR